MSLDNVSSTQFLGKDYALELKEKADKAMEESRQTLQRVGVSIPIGQPQQKSTVMTGLEIEKSNDAVDKVQRELTSDDAIGIAEAEARNAFAEYGASDGKKVATADEVRKMAHNYVENEQHKEDVQATNVFMNKAEYKAAEKERKAERKELVKQYRADGLSKKEAKQKADSQLVENEYIRGRKTRAFVEDHRDYFYDENGKFSSDKFKQKAVEYANTNTIEGETTNYHLSLKERRAVAQQEGVDAAVIKNIAKKSNLSYEKDNTNLYRGLVIGGATTLGIVAGPLFGSSAAAAAAASSSSSSAATGAGGAAASSSSSSAAAAAAAKTNGRMIGGTTGFAVGLGFASLVKDNGNREARVYAPGEPQEIPVRTPSNPEPPVAQPNQPAPATPVPVIPTPCPENKPCPCNSKVEKGHNWYNVIRDKMQYRTVSVENGITTKGEVKKLHDGSPVLKALTQAIRLKHGVTDMHKNTFPPVYSEKAYQRALAISEDAAKKYEDSHSVTLYTDFSDLFENEKIMKKYPSLKLLKGLEFGADCDANVKVSSYGKPKVPYTKWDNSRKAPKDC